MTARLSDDDLRLLHANLYSAEDDLETTRRCLDLRSGPYHLEQAIEKLIKSVSVIHGNPWLGGHSLRATAAALPDTEEMKTALLLLAAYEDYATSYRYASPSGTLRQPPPEEDLKRDLDLVRELIQKFRTRTFPDRPEFKAPPPTRTRRG